MQNGGMSAFAVGIYVVQASKWQTVNTSVTLYKLWFACYQQQGVAVKYHWQGCLPGPHNDRTRHIKHQRVTP